MKKKTTKKIKIKPKKVKVKKMVEVKKVEKVEAEVKVEVKKKSFTIVNLGSTPAKELKPGIGVFEIPVNGSIVVEDEEIAKSLVNDSGGKLAFKE